MMRMAAHEWVRYRQVRTALAESRMATLIGDDVMAARWASAGLTALEDLRSPEAAQWLRAFSPSADAEGFLRDATGELARVASTHGIAS
jgi:hypothetical protein